jgi:oligosaccharide reducing-end xylanase
MLSLAYRTRLLRGLCALALAGIFATACGAGEPGGMEGTAGTPGAAGAAGMGTGGARAGSPGSAGAAGATPLPSKTTANLFVTIGGRTQSQVDDKVTTAVNRFFGIGTGEPSTPTAATGYRCYYELPNDASMGYIWAADSDDVRSEGMSYGMMIAVQTDLHEQFDKLWKFAKTYMQYPASGGAWSYYFKWQGRVSGSTVTFGAGPAPDGDEYFAAALYLADKRWGSTGPFNYKQEADNISAAMLHNTATGDGRVPIINAGANMVVFYPQGASGNFTDPSYHLPAFYELFALYGPSGDAAKWRSIATTSRSFLVTSAHATTGLHPDYATFQGAPTTAMSGDGHNEFRYDAWRVVMNMAVDYAWFSGSAAMKTQVEKYHAFFASHLINGNVAASLFKVDGSGASGGGSTALTATLAAGGLASTATNRTTYVNNLWNIGQQSGQYRYYQESVYLLGLLATAGKLSYAW